MTTTVRTTAIRRVPTDTLRTTSLVAGGLYLVKGFTSSPLTGGMAGAEGRSNGDAAIASAAVSR